MEKITISFDLIVALIGFSLGITFSFLLTAVNKIETLREKFGSPVNGNFELDWTTKQLLAVFSKSASQRWYEARVYLGSGIFIAVLCAIKLMYVVRFDFELASDSRRGFTRKRCYHGFRSFDRLEKAILRDVPKIQETAVEDSFFSGALITGHNFVSM